MRLHVHVCVLLGLNCMSRTDPGDFRLQGAAYILGVISPLSILLSHVPYSFSETCQTSNCIRVPAPRADTAHLQSSRRPSSVVLLQLSNPLYGVRTLPVSRSPLAPSSIIRCPPTQHLCPSRSDSRLGEGKPCLQKTETKTGQTNHSLLWAGISQRHPPWQRGDLDSYVQRQRHLDRPGTDRQRPTDSRTRCTPRAARCPRSLGALRGSRPFWQGARPLVHRILPAPCASG